MKGCPTGHAAHREHLDRDPLVIQVDVRLVPIYLRLITPGVLLWYEGLRHHAQPKRLFPLPHILTHRRLGDLVARPLFDWQPHRDRTLDGLAHHASVHAELAGHPGNTG